MMNTKRFTTFRTSPFEVVSYDEPPDPDLLDCDKVLDGTHPIVCFVAFVQASQHGTRKLTTAETEPASTPFQLPAVLDLACHAGMGFKPVVTPAPGAGLPLSCIGTAEATVHAAGSYQHFPSPWRPPIPTSNSTP